MSFKTFISTSFILAANLTPLIGATFSDWTFYLAVWAYWIETLIIGLFGLVKIRISSEHNAIPYNRGNIIMMFFGVLAVCAGVIYKPGMVITWPLLFVSFGLPAIAFLFSHYLNFKINFLGQAEYRNTLPEHLALSLFGRIVVLFVIAYATMEWADLLVVVIIKTIFEVLFHLRTRTRSWTRGRETHGERWL